MTTYGRWNPRSYSYAKSEESIMYWKGNITEKRYRIQVMLEDPELDQSVTSISINSIT